MSARCLALFAITVALHAQTSTNGSLRGRVLDPGGLGVPAARVLLTSIVTGGELTASSDGDGSYLFPRLAPGQYRVTVEKIGFRKAVRDAVQVGVNETSVADMRLVLGEVAEFITVAG